MLDLSALRGIAEAATPGPWKVETVDYEGSWVAFLSSDARLEAAEKVIEDALAWMDAGDGLFTDHPLWRILSAYTKGTDHD